MKIVRVALAVLALLTAPVLLLQGAANAEQEYAPPTWNGFRLAELSRAFLQAEQTEDGGLVLAVREGGRDIAVDAWLTEPLATDGLFVAAADLRASGENERLDELLSLAAELDKRNRFIGVLQMEQSVASGRYDAAFAILDRLALANPSIIPEMTSVLKQMLNREGTVALLRDVLDSEPSWVAAFWNGIPPEPAALQRMYELRQLTDTGTTAETDALLVGGLVDAGFYEQAIDLWSETSQEEARPFAFRDDAQFAPIGWKVVSSGQRSFSSRGEGRFELYAQQYTEGEVARQLVQLPPGRYAFSASIAPASDAALLEASLYCASDENPNAPAQPLDDVATWTVAGDCAAYWLVLEADAWERRSPLELTVTDMSFGRAGGTR